MNKSLVALGAAAGLLCTTASAVEGNVPHSPFGRLDHVFLIMMENHLASEIIGGSNPNTPFLNAYAKHANLAANYWAVGHPSLTNYLEVVGGSNFGVIDDFWPNWSNGGCVDNNPSGSGCGGAVTPIVDGSADYAFPATVDACQAPWFNQLGPLPQCATAGSGTAVVANNWGIVSYPSAGFTAKTIAHQLVEDGRSWKTYQESLPSIGSAVDGVNYSDGSFSNLDSADAWFGAAKKSVQKLYAVKHNPFVYFKDVQTNSADSGLGLAQTVDFVGSDGLYADLARGTAPTFSFIAPNQCHDMHGAGGGSAQCANDAHSLQMGDAAVRQIVAAIKASPSWHEGRNAIVVMWDENDYGNYANQVVLMVDTNYGRHGAVSKKQYNHYSLTRTLQAGFGLPCLNHACDDSTKIMSDLFGRDDH
jgi:phosphatidylinositol-3-phosphatase